MSDGFQIMAIAHIVRRAERDHKERIPLAASTYPRQSAADETHAAVYARLNSQQVNDAPAADGCIDVEQVGA